MMSKPSSSTQSEPSASTSASPVVERTPSPPAPEPEHEEEEEEGDILLRAEKVKEQGNVAFKAKRWDKS
jgi:DnaJ family protein C protein 7